MRVVIESPLASPTYLGVVKHLHYARLCLKDSLNRGESPFASHLLYTQVLDDTDLKEREQGIAGQLAWLEVCDLVAVYIDYGVSNGMKAAISCAEGIKPIDYRYIGRTI